MTKLADVKWDVSENLEPTEIILSGIYKNGESFNVHYSMKVDEEATILPPNHPAYDKAKLK